jgi:hypothetical protein
MKERTAYETPEVVELGAIRTVTQGGGVAMCEDGGLQEQVNCFKSYICHQNPSAPGC